MKSWQKEARQETTIAVKSSMISESEKKDVTEMKKNVQTATSILLHVYSQLISAVEPFALTRATRTMEKIMTMIVRDKILIRANLFQEMRTLHNMRIGIVMTTVFQFIRRTPT